MTRLRTKKLFVIGLTGGIGMGKSTAARILNNIGMPIYNADKVVHDLLGKRGGAARAVADLFPESVRRGKINRKILGSLVFGKADKLVQLEKILHPLVHRAERDFLAKARREKSRAGILEIPLMFETGADQRCDIVICVTAPRSVQEARVMRRKGMTREKYKAILRHQMSDRQKRKLADHVVHTGKGYADTKRQLFAILATHDLIEG